MDVESYLSQQYGLITAEQLRLSTGQRASNAARSLDLVSCRPGVYMRAGSQPSSFKALMEVSLVIQEPHAVSHETAAHFWGMKPAPMFEHSNEIHFTVATHGRSRVMGAFLHRAMALPVSDIQVVRGIPVTTPARTLVDLTGYWTEGEIGWSYDQARKLGLVSMRDIREVVGRLGPGPRRPTNVILGLICERAGEAEKCQSQGELRVYWWVHDEGLKVPIPQFEVQTSRGSFWLDFFFPEHNLAVEVDGDEVHSMPGARERDRLRQQTIEREHGIKFVRFDEFDDRDWVLSELRRLGIPRVKDPIEQHLLGYGSR